ncbi:MAG: sugar ABC transporter ATP-binding protein, partial [Rhodomicrobiaceae bacterium]
PDSLIGELDVAEQQLVEVAKAVSLDAKVIVMDEPTAALNEHECQVLFGLVDKLRDQGHAIVYITHRMPEIARLADRVTVLKDGRLAAEYDHVPEPDAVIRAMVGRDIGDFYPPQAKPEEIGKVVLAVKDGGNDRLHDIDLELRAGEIAGFAGIQGAGRTALAMALFGEEPLTRGTVTLNGERVQFTRTRDAIRAGIGLLPGDRKAEALLLMQSVRDNAMVGSRALSGFAASHEKTPFGDSKAMDALLDRLDVRATSYDQEIQSLSGGNQQKAVVARWLALAPKVLLFIEPTRGIDVNAKAGIYHLMRDLAREGAAIMMVSSDLPEVIGAADRILVMRDGTIVGEFPRGVSEAEIMHAATGETEMAGAA